MKEHRSKIINLVCFLFLLAVGVGLFTKPVETEDIWWHLKAGSYILDAGRVPQTDPFTFEGEHTVWVYTQWLGGVFYSLIYKAAGLKGLIFFRVAFFLSFVSALFINMRRHMPSVVGLWILLVLMFALETRAMLRPMIFNFLFIQIFLSALFAHRETNRWTSLLPLLFAGLFWVNIHLGSFMYGMLLIGLFWCVNLWEYFFPNKITLLTESSKESGWQRQRHLSLIGLFYLALFWLTPYGHDGAMHPWRTLLIPEYLNFGQIHGSIAELQPPKQLFSLLYFWFFVFFVLGAMAIWADKSRRFLNTLLFLTALGMFLFARRGNIFFCLISLNICLQTARRMNLRQKWSQLVRHQNINFLFQVGFIAVCVALVALMQPSLYFLDGAYTTRWTRVLDHHNPNAMIQFLQDHHVSGPILNDDRYGGFLLFSAYPRIRPFVDSRQLDYNLHKEYHALRRDPEGNLELLHQKHKFQAALLDVTKKANHRLLAYLLKDKNWLLVHVVRSQALFMPRALASESDDLLFYEENLRNTAVLADFLPPVKLKKIQYNELADTALTLFDIGYPKAGLRMMQQAFQAGANATQWHIYRVMQENYLATQKSDE